VSHSHLNHSNDINAVIDAMTYSGMDKNGVLVASKAVVNDNEKQKASLNQYYRDFLERFIVLEAGQRVGINEIEVLALKTKHSEENTIGFKFFTPYFTLSYSADTKYFPELIEQYKNSNILILNVPYVNKEEAKNNLCIEDAIKIIKEVKPRLAILQHFGIEIVKGDPLYLIREVQKATGVQTIAAKDGMVINPLSYSVDRGQRTLQIKPSEQKAEIKEENEYGAKEIQEDAIEETTEEQQETLNQISQTEEPLDVNEAIETKKEENILESNKPLKDILKGEQ